MKKKFLIRLLYSLIFIVFLILLKPIIHLSKTRWKENMDKFDIPKGYTNDASRLNQTRVDTTIHAEIDKELFIQQLKKLLNIAKKRNIPISIAGARHSMGGHTMYPSGIIVDMLPFNQIRVDTVNNILYTGAGAKWIDIIEYLNKFNRSVKVMQAFSSFSIGGSISVNGHGWQKNSPPVSSTIRSLKVMTTDGMILRCSKNENSELFSLIIGGYGLFGIILEVELDIVKNTELHYICREFPTAQYLDYFKQYVVNDDRVELVFGRLDISKENFLKTATLNTFSKTKSTPNSSYNTIPKELKRLIFRGTVHSDYGKNLRSNLEKWSLSIAKNQVFNRNEILSEEVNLIENRDSMTVDILQEYFIPDRNFVKFIQEIKTVLPHQNIDLLNITIRDVNKDSLSYLNYAREHVFGFVFLFNQLKTAKGEQEMKKLTQQLTQIALKSDGTYYLPYRLHNHKELFTKSYPQAEHFFKLKLKYDPSMILQNKFYEQYK